MTSRSNGEPRPGAQEPLMPEARRRAIAELLRTNGAVTVGEVERDFGVSSMTARRDLGSLERRGLARRTHGGAVLPSMATHEHSFENRLETEADGKRALAAEAVGLITPHQSVFLDSSTTAYYVAGRILDEAIAITLLTNSEPVMDLVATRATSNVELIAIGGALRYLTRSFVGPHAVQMVLSHYVDQLFLSVKGVTADGTLTDADPLEAEVKRAMVQHAREPVLMIDSSKLGVSGLSAIGPVSDLARVLHCGWSEDELGPLRAPGVRLHAVRSADGG